MSARLDALAKQIADVSVRSEVELFAKSVLDDDGHPLYTIPLPDDESADAQRVRDALQYIEGRGAQTAFPWVMLRSGSVVWFVDHDEPVAGAPPEVG